MGSSVSKNITNAVTTAIAKVSNNIIVSTKLSTDQTQIISVSDVDGDVHISGNTFTQKANINIKSLLNALVQESVQQDLTMQIAQECKSIVSGLNLLQFPNAQNEINLLLKGSVELLNTISHSCGDSLSENQVIEVSRVKGNVYITNNVFTQIADIFQSCVSDAVSNNTIFQQLQQKIDQNASAKAEGLDMWQIIILVAIILGVPIGGIAVVGRYLFPLSILTGAGCLAAYYAWVDETVYSHAFSPLIRYVSDCNAQLLPKSFSTAYPNSASAAQACANNRHCAAFDWQGALVNADGTHKTFLPPQTTFYSSVGVGCEETIKSSPDHSKLFRNPIFVKGDGPPLKAHGDVYLDTKTADYYFIDQETKVWVKQASFAHSDFTSRNTINWGTVKPNQATQAIAGSIYVYYDLMNPIYFYVYVKNPDGWKLMTPLLKGPGLIPDAPANINVSGFTSIARKNYLLYIGGAFLAVGILGSAFSVRSNK